MMKIDILTLFPNMFRGFLNESLILRAQKNRIVKIKIWDLRKFAHDRHHTVDDRPYGGGPGMVLRVDIVNRALSTLKSKFKNQKLKIILLTPQGKIFNQKMAKKLSKKSHLILLCGHYEGFDERIRKLIDMEISIGDYILTGGEIPAMALCDATIRLIPGVVGKKESLREESFSFSSTSSTAHYPLSTTHCSLLEYPQYTRPENFQGYKVPHVLLSGDHQKIAAWRKKMSLAKTRRRRPDLLK